MKKRTWIPLIIIVVGVCLALAGFAGGGMQKAWIDRSGFHLGGSELGNMVTVNEKYNNIRGIDLNVDYLARITFKEGNGFSVQGQNYERFGGLNVRADGGKLYVEAKRTGRWLNFGLDDFRQWNTDNTWIEITYPKGAELNVVTAIIGAGRVYASDLNCDELYLDNSFGKIDVTAVNCDRLTIKSSSGDTQVSDINVKGSATISNDFGKLELSNATADNLSVKLSAGDARARNVRANTLKMTNDFGKITLDGATTNDLTLRLSSGDLSAGDIKTGILFVESSFGRVGIENLELSGRGEIEQSSGDTQVSLNMSENDLSYDLNASAGSVKVGGNSYGGSVVNRVTGVDASLRINSDLGGISLKFMR